MFLKKCIYQ